MTKVTISKWGNSSAIRLPKAVMDELGLADGETVDLTVRNGQRVLLGVFRTDEPPKHIEFFILKVDAMTVE